MRFFILRISEYVYRSVRPLIFLSDSERVHGFFTRLGELLGGSETARNIALKTFVSGDSRLAQTIHGVRFENPVGLAAGFDYEGRLTGILRPFGFGFGTVGTVTNRPYEGNPPPRLGRLVKSRSLLVNKGFKNLGVEETLKNLGSSNFDLPVGLSIGKTNTKDPMTQDEAVEDVVRAFRTAESSPVPFGYYELNISCPNLYGNVEFYEPGHLKELLSRVTGLKLGKPLFIKMPIDKTDDETKEMMDAITHFPVQGVIFGNLLRNRSDPALDKKEAVKYMKGGFSGKPTEKRSNELIRLAYGHSGRKLVIIGCGGIFSAEDAYKKIKLGASLVQLITGLVYVGPQLPARINLWIVKLLEKDGFAHVSQAVGVEA
jgi:dihydroorotate dehydrogenase subfamily 2